MATQFEPLSWPWSRRCRAGTHFNTSGTVEVQLFGVADCAPGDRFGNRQNRGTDWPSAAIQWA